MDNANKFFERLGNNILNEVHTTVEGIVENKKGNLYDVKANGLPLLINLPTLTIKSKGKSIKNDLDKGDRVLVAFSKSNLSDGYIIGSIDEDSIDLVDFIQEHIETEGLKGEKGDKGDKGDQGPEGPQGPKGDTGPQGPRGESGYTPIKGIDYFDGEKGEKGDQGERGISGEQGPKGDKGDSIEYIWSGTQLGIRLEGQTSYQYVNLKGDKGDKGNTGDKGEPGERGPKGDQGIQGDTGESGKSIEYQWNGTSLGVRLEGQTSYQYVNLKGEKGDAGLKGDTGDQGPRGLQGIQGPKGDQGPPGKDGSDATVTKDKIVKELGYTPVDSKELTSHILDNLNPHKVTKGQVGLGNVDNTSDTEILDRVKEDYVTKEEANSKIGQLEDLETEEKVIVGAINEVNQKFNSIPEADKPMVLAGTSLPSASQTYRGVIFTVLGNEDIPYICLKNGSKYEWQRLLGGFI